MPTLEEIRRALREGDNPTDIPPKESKGLSLAKVRKLRQGKFTISINGADAVLHFGKNSGSSVSDLARDRGGRTYLNWILENFGEDDLKEVVKYCLIKAGHPPPGIDHVDDEYGDEDYERPF